MNAQGCDTSKWQYPINYELARERGLYFNIGRATIGDYYTDVTLPENFNGYKQAGLLVSAYLVTAPRDPTGTRVITAQAHLDRFFNAVYGLSPDFSWWLDAELDRGADKEEITELHVDIINGIKSETGKYPVIYTRASWWDVHTLPHPVFKKCDLHAARYANFLTSPWSDGKCKFRDWTDWKFWQKTDRGDGKYFGVGSKQLDIDDFNGDVGQLYDYANLPRPLTLEDKVNILLREAKAHGWNIEQ